MAWANSGPIGNQIGTLTAEVSLAVSWSAQALSAADRHVEMVLGW
jgi:hypothetical protein